MLLYGRVGTGDELSDEWDYRKYIYGEEEEKKKEKRLMRMKERQGWTMMVPTGSPGAHSRPWKLGARVRELPFFFFLRSGHVLFDGAGCRCLIWISGESRSCAYSLHAEKIRTIRRRGERMVQQEDRLADRRTVLSERYTVFVSFLPHGNETQLPTESSLNPSLTVWGLCWIMRKPLQLVHNIAVT